MRLPISSPNHSNSPDQNHDQFRFSSLNNSNHQDEGCCLIALSPSTGSRHLANQGQSDSVSLLDYMRPCDGSDLFVESEVQFKELVFVKRKNTRTGHSRYFYFGHPEFRNFHKGYAKPERLHWAVGRFLKYKLLTAQGFIRPDDMYL